MKDTLVTSSSRENTAGRALWIIWCLSWAAVWLVIAVAAWLSPVKEPGICLVAAGLSIGSGVAILCPVGKR